MSTTLELKRSGNMDLESLSASTLIEWAVDRFGQSLAVSTSFGIQSAVTLQLATRVLPEVPVIWVDTGLPSTGDVSLRRRIGVATETESARLSIGHQSGANGSVAWSTMGDRRCF